jgi:hypothetical protein
MLASSDDVLDKVRTREVTGVFHSRKALVDAAEELLVAGFDRADIDVSASLDELDLGARSFSGERGRGSGTSDAAWRGSRPRSRNRPGETAGGSSARFAATGPLAG